MKVGLLQARRTEAVARAQRLAETVPWGAKRSLKESWIGSTGPIGRIHGGEGARPLSWEVAGGVRWRWPRVKGRQSGVGGRRDAWREGEGDNLASTQQKAAVAVPCCMTLYIISSYDRMTVRCDINDDELDAQVSTTSTSRHQSVLCVQSSTKVDKYNPL